MPDFGLSSAGFLSMTATEIKSELDDAFKASFGESIGSEADGSIPAASKIGALIAILVDREAALWDIAEALYAASDPAQAGGASQDALCSLTGTIREEAEFSSVVATCCGTPATVLPVGRVATVEDTATRFASQSSDTDTNAPNSTITVLDAWVALTIYSVGDRVTNSSKCYECITGGTSAASGGPSITAADITDGSVHWTILGEGTGAVDVTFLAEETGIAGAAAYALNTIGTPVSGWQSVLNLAASENGNDEEEDSALRLRREDELAAQGNATANAIRADVLRVDEVTSCRVFYNDTDATDSNGLPPHSVEVLVLNGDNPDIAAAIFNSVAAGIYTHGTTAVTLTDDAGNVQTVRFTRPTEIPIYVDIDAVYDSSVYTGEPADLEDDIIDAIVALGLEYQIGQDVKERRVSATVYERDNEGNPLIPGIVDVTDCDVGTSPSPSGSSVTIGIRELAVIVAANITVNLSTGSL